MSRLRGIVVAPRAPRRPSRKARGERIPGVFDRRATPRSGMPRRPNAHELRRHDTGVHGFGLMRYLILTDIHANLEALETVSEPMRRLAATTETLVLGDLVGYGADPNAVIDRVRALGRRPSCAATTTRWRSASTRPTGSTPWRERPRIGCSKSLTPENREWVAALPQGPRAVDDLIEICHGAPLRRGCVHLRRDRRPPGAQDGDQAAVSLRPHALPRHLRAHERHVHETRAGGRNRSSPRAQRRG